MTDRLSRGLTAARRELARQRAAEQWRERLDIALVFIACWGVVLGVIFAVAA
jgi:4-amino-4-deoxy-L-arabinose transferase-like glycosyltransferase